MNLPKKIKIKKIGQSKSKTVNTIDYLEQKLIEIQDFLNKNPQAIKYEYPLTLEKAKEELFNLLNLQPITRLGSEIENDVVKEYKYYVTSIIYRIRGEILDSYQVNKTTQQQYEIACKAKSVAEANRILHSLIRQERVFRTGFYHELSLSSHYEQIKQCEKHGTIIYLSTYPGITVSLKEIVEKNNALRKY